MAIQSEWQRKRLEDELRRGLHSRTGPVARALKGLPPIKSPPNRAFDKLNDQLSREIKRAIDSAIRAKTPQHSRADAERAAAAGTRIDFNGVSECFDELSWQNGTAHAVFQNGYTYSAPLDLDTFLDWVDDGNVTEGSAGKFFNHVLGQQFFAGR